MRRRLNDLAHEARIFKARVSSVFAKEALEQPIFLIGCGRSGKSMLGAALMQHPQVCFLDESRPLWIAAFPHCDIWTKRAAKRNGRLYLDEQDADPQGSSRLGRLFQREATQRKRPVVVQALAANSFRMRFLHRVFPQARFIHVTRNGLHVAQEIAARADKNGWYGRTGHKWAQLAAYAASRAHSLELLSLCQSNFERALLEWRLGVEAVREASAILPPDALLELRYEDLIAQPQTHLQRVAEFLDLDRGADWAVRASNAPNARAANTHAVKASERDLLIGGSFLQAWLA